MSKPVKQIVIFHERHLFRVQEATRGAEHLFDLQPLTDEQVKHQGINPDKLYMLPAMPETSDRPFVFGRPEPDPREFEMQYNCWRWVMP